MVEGQSGTQVKGARVEASRGRELIKRQQGERVDQEASRCHQAASKRHQDASAREHKDSWRRHQDASIKRPSRPRRKRAKCADRSWQTATGGAAARGEGKEIGGGKEQRSACVRKSRGVRVCAHTHARAHGRKDI